MEVLLPQKYDFIRHSNSQALRMYFDTADIEGLSAKTAHMRAIHIAPGLLEEFETRGCMLGLKLSFNRKTGGVTRSIELFQSLNSGARGCLNERDEWVAEAAFCRSPLSCGRLRFFRSAAVLPETAIIDPRL